MTKFLIALLLAFSLFSCDTPKNKAINLYDLVPEKSSYIIESENIFSFLNEIDTNILLNDSDVFKSFDLEGIKNYTSLFTPTNSFIYFIRKDSLNYDYVYLSKPQNDSLIKSAKNDFSIETITTKDFSYKKTIIGKSTVYSTENNKILFASNSLKILREAIDKDKLEKSTSNNFKKVIAAKSKGKTSLFVHHKSSRNSMADWSVVDLDLSTNKLNFNGIAITQENSKQLLRIFQGVQHQKNEIAKVTPNSSTGFYSFTYNDYNTISKNLLQFRGDSLSALQASVLNYTKEAGVILMGNGTAIALTFVDPELAMDAFPIKDALNKEFRGISIYYASDINYLKSFEPLISEAAPKFYMLLENFLIFSEKLETLESIIGSFQNNLALDKNFSFEKIKENLADASSLLIVSKASKENSLLLNTFNPISTLSKNYSLAATQFVSNDGFTHIHGVVLDDSDIKSEKNQELVTTTLPINIDGKSYVLKNHNTNEVELAIQDADNVLSLLTLDGKVLWKKKLQTQIIGDITQVDLFKNGNLQMAFSTLNKFHILDRNGKDVKSFPIEFKDNITQPVVIFDYDKTKNYRFLIVQNNELLMYDSKGKIVKGFDFKKAPSEITQTPKHIRIKNKDYIVFPEKSGKLNILSRQGKERILIKEKFQFSENEWYENKNDFISVSEDGKLVRIAQNGRVSKKELNHESNLQVVANENILVILSEIILTINDKELTLDFGLYSNPRIFSASGKTYISTTDTQAKKVYLFNEKGDLIPNFPVYGISLISLTSSKTRNKSILLVLGESNEIVTYIF